jgi:hypothetical protein
MSEQPEMSTNVLIEEMLVSKTTQRRRLVIAVILFISYVLATFQVLRSYLVTNQPYLDAVKYASGIERMPYQSRVLMALIMRHAQTSQFVTKIAGKLRGPFHAPDVVAIGAVGLLSFLLLAVVVRAFYRHISPHGPLSWMPYFLVLWMASATYVVRYQEAIYFPYDLLAAALFTLCIYLCYRKRYVLLLPVFVLACFNRETVIMIVPLVLINAFFSDRSLTTYLKGIATAAVMIALWVFIHLHVTHLYANNATELGFRVHENLRFLSSPWAWPQIASACGFLCPVPFLFWSVLYERRLRGYALLIPAWIAIMFAVGLLPESRIFGELIGILAVLCTVVFERAYGRVSSAARSPLQAE